MKFLMRFLLWTAGVVIGILLLLLILLVRPSQISREWHPDPAEMQALQSAAGKLGSAFYQGRREPKKKIRIHFTVSECRVMLSTLGRVANQFIGDKAGVARLENRAGDLDGCAEINLPVGVIPVHFAVNGAIRKKDLQVKIQRVRAGWVPVPAGCLQKIADPFIADCKKGIEFRALVSGIDRFEFLADGTLVLEATPAACMKLLQELL